MEKNNYINVFKNIYVYSRDNSKNGVWHFYFRLNGKARRGTTGCVGLDDAKMVAVQKFHEAQANPHKATSKKISFKAVATSWLALQAGDKDMSRHETAVNRFLVPYFDGDINLKDMGAITQSQINNYIIWRRNYWVTGPGSVQATMTYEREGKTVKSKAPTHGITSNGTINRENIALSNIFKYAIDEGVLSHTARIAVPRLKTEDVTRPDFTDEQADLICNLARQRASISNLKVARERRILLAYVILLRYTGMRPGELLSLTWRDVDIEGRRISLRGVTGGSKTGVRAVPLMFDEAIDQLNDLMRCRCAELGAESVRPGENLFIDPDGTAIKCFKRSFPALIKACNFDPPPGNEGYTAYSFRHSFITTLGKMGMPDALQTKALGTSREMIGVHYDHNSINEALRWMDANRKPKPPEASESGGGWGEAERQFPDDWLDP